MTSQERFPFWPPPPGKSLGIDRAKLMMIWLKANVPELLYVAEVRLREEFLVGEIQTRSRNLQQIAMARGEDRGLMYLGDVALYNGRMFRGKATIWMDGVGRLVLSEGIGLHKGPAKRMWPSEIDDPEGVHDRNQ